MAVKSDRQRGNCRGGSIDTLKVDDFGNRGGGFRYQYAHRRTMTMVRFPQATTLRPRVPRTLEGSVERLTRVKVRSGAKRYAAVKDAPYDAAKFNVRSRKCLPLPAWHQ
jgi:hypothetical protein